VTIGSWARYGLIDSPQSSETPRQYAYQDAASAMVVHEANGTVSEAAWRSKPSWYLVATDDRMIPPPAQRTMAKRIGATVTETPGSHAVYVSTPAPVVGLITQAARSALRETTAVG
jgi:pimeloyl-ACP methyl ester carboxylesterase